MRIVWRNWRNWKDCCSKI